MELKLNYLEHTEATAAAAFIRGGEPESWFAEIDRWGIPYQRLVCYVVPESLNSLSAAGLFVIFQEKPSCAWQAITNPYRHLAEGLYIPLQATLYPEVSREELKQLVLHEVCLFHPSIGMVGYEPSDKLTVRELLQLHEPLKTIWEDPLPFQPVFPSLTRIGLIRQQSEDLMKDLQEDIGSQPLEDIKKKERASSSFEKFTDSVSLFGLRGAAAAMGGVAGLLSGLLGLGASGKGIRPVSPQVTEAVPLQPPGKRAGGAGKGWLSRFQDWMDRKIKDLEKKRESELDRLMDLFDKDMEEALRHAIPLGSNYLERGETNNPGWKLQRHDLNFDLKRLGGGRMVDTWDIGRREADLRQKYHEAARKEIEAGNHKRAAYIYAHLLNDYHSAANTLRSAGMYREAAILYKEHLKNLSAAAECYELGRLHHEAIELYLELKNYEKAGDIYASMEQKEKADLQYEKCVAQALDQQDYLEAARILEYKVNDDPRSRQILLEGWEYSGQQERCLERYFDRLNRHEPDQVLPQLRQVYRERTPRSKRGNFLNVIRMVFQTSKDPEVRENTREMAFEIVGEHLEQGHADTTDILKYFAPEDRLLPQDLDRYVHNNPSVKRRFQEPVSQIHLGREHRWAYGKGLGDQWIAIGYQGEVCHLVRGNWRNHKEQKALLNLQLSSDNWDILYEPGFTPQMFQFGIKGSSMRQVLGSNEHFQKQFILEFPHWAPESMIASALTGNNRISFLCYANEQFSLHHYSLRGGVLGVNAIEMPEDRLPHVTLASNKMVYRGDRLYFASGEYLYTLSMEGRLTIKAEIGHVIHALEADPNNPKLKLYLATERGCIIVQSRVAHDFDRSEHFASEHHPYALQHYSDNCLFLIEHRQVHLYDLRNAEPAHIGTIGSETEIIAVFSIDRTHFGVLEKSGTINVHTMAW